MSFNCNKATRPTCPSKLLALRDKSADLFQPVIWKLFFSTNNPSATDQSKELAISRTFWRLYV